MRATLIKAERLAATDISVLITGETGTGKTRVARLIHEKSARSEHAFVSINCASLPEQLQESELFGHVRGSFTGATDSRAGLFEEADGGTIFLDEVDTLSPAMQAKLLSVLQARQIRRVGSNKSKQVDIRVISATNQVLDSLMERGHFRSDLYFRLNGIRLHLPPLRERGEDLKRLLTRFLGVYSAKYKRSGLSLTPRALACVQAYPYPGNIRQLENFVEQMVVFADGAGGDRYQRPARRSVAASVQHIRGRCPRPIAARRGGQPCQDRAHVDRGCLAACQAYRRGCAGIGYRPYHPVAQDARIQSPVHAKPARIVSRIVWHAVCSSSAGPIHGLLFETNRREDNEVFYPR